ncbi:MAG: hypothetical protein GWP91_07605, partial [Rhodobacterales bacterium]|nr:hypothetical protein [Rhodobacterales bacterium]
EAQMRVTPTLVLTANGKEVAEVQDADLSDRVDGLVQKAGAYGTVSQSYWAKSLPKLLSQETLSNNWRRQWADSWGLVYNHDWVAGETAVLTSPVTDDEISFTYQDVVPCKFNEDEPLCVRITFESDPSANTRLRLIDESDARIRMVLPPNHQDAGLVTVNGARSGELVIEATTGLPWRWSSNTREHYVFNVGEERTTEIAHHRDVEMSCDWRVAESPEGLAWRLHVCAPVRPLRQWKYSRSRRLESHRNPARDSL